MRKRSGWRVVLCGLSAAIAASSFAILSPSYAAEPVTVPVDLQALLLARVAAYDRNLPARAGARIEVLLLKKVADAGSERLTAQMAAALGKIEAIAGLPHAETIAGFNGASELAELCRAKQISIVYLAPELADAVPAIAEVLGKLNVLSVGAVPSFVPKGIVLGFDLVSGKPKLLLNMPQAKRQGVALSSEVLKLMRIYE